MSLPLLSLDAFRQAAPTAADWQSLLPEILVAALGLVALVQALVVPAAARWLIPTVARLGLLGAGWLALTTPTVAGPLFAGLVEQDAFTGTWRSLFILCALLTSLIGSRFFRSRGADEAEFHHVLLVLTAALMLLAQSAHVATFFVALETATVGLYILVGFLRTSRPALEAAVKYLVAGGLSSAFLLMGFVLLQGLAGADPANGADPLAFGSIANALAGNPQSPLGLVGAALVLVGIGFKVGAFPFHGWVPDVYQGAPTPTTALLATASKAAGVVGLLLLVQGPLFPLHERLAGALTLLAAGSLLAGNLGALGSTDAKRALALSGVSHAGFLLATLADAAKFAGLAGEPGDGSTMLAAMAPAILLAYLLAYILGTFATLGALAATPSEDDARRPLLGLRGLIARDGSLAASLTLGIGSLAGIPPSAGFFAKLLVLFALASVQSWLLLGLAVVSVAISIHYYFSIVREAVSRTEVPGERLVTRWQDRAVPLALGSATVLLGLAILVSWASSGGR